MVTASYRFGTLMLDYVQGRPAKVKSPVTADTNPKECTSSKSSPPTVTKIKPAAPKDYISKETPPKATKTRPALPKTKSTLPKTKLTLPKSERKDSSTPAVASDAAKEAELAEIDRLRKIGNFKGRSVTIVSAKVMISLYICLEMFV